jgi:replicative DNA helicase
MVLNNTAAERAVLSGMCQHGMDAYIDIDGILSPCSFTNDLNQMVFKCLEHVFNHSERVDVSSILAAASAIGYYEILSGDDEQASVQELFHLPTELVNVVHNAKIIKKLEISRQIQSVVKGIHSKLAEVTGEETFTEILSIAESPIMELDAMLSNGEADRPIVLGEEVEDYIQHLIDNPSNIVGVSSGFPRFDSLIGGGLRRGCIDFVSARPKTGKSMFADNVAIHVSEELNIPVLMIDTEMGKEDHYNRVLANLSGVPINEISNGSFSKDQSKHERVSQAIERMKEMPFHYVGVAGKSFEEIIALIRRWVEKNVGIDEEGRRQDCLVVYDYLKLMSSSDLGNNAPEWLVLGSQIMDLHALCVKQDFPCLTFGQLNRDGITREDAGVVSGSDRIVWNCSSFSIFKIKTIDEIAEDGPEGGNRKLLPIVSRHGPGMENGSYINMNMMGHIGRVTEGVTRDELAEARIVGIQGFEIDESEDSETED